MEAAEGASLEPAIAWLVQTILATLLVDKLDTWIRQAGFGDDIERLKSEIRRTGMAVSAVKGRAIGNELLSQSLAFLKELLYDADDVVDELDYYRLQQQVQGVTRDEAQGIHGVERVDETSRGDADTQNSSVGKLRSMVWEHFNITAKDKGKPVKSVCIYCAKEFTCKTKNGTSSMSKHIKKICKKKPRVLPPNLSSTDDAISVVIGDSCSRKRRRVDEDSTQIIASNTQTPWDKDILSSRIQKIASQLQDIRGDLGEFLKLHGSDLASSSNHHPTTDLDQHLRTSSIVPRKVYGRVAEKDYIVKMITEEISDGVVVLPIVGIAGVGKTTLAQLVYNDTNVQFDQRIWVWVSHNFDEVRLTRDILDSFSGERHPEINCFAKLQEMLRSYANSKRFLLILDNVWDGMNKVLAPLVSSHVNGNVILVTTRNMSVAQSLGTLKPVKLDALANDDFWLLFKSHAFGYENYDEHQSISIIGRKIAEKLRGSPLAAVSTGELLRNKLNTAYWRDILMNEDWKSLQHSRGIMSALKLSYDQLPYHLQLCFSYCSIFPYSYQFLGEELVSFWIAQRFVKCNNSSQSVQGIGRCYLIDLVNLGFLQEVKREESYLGSQILYAVCGIMYDFAMMVSKVDCASIDGLQCNKMPQTLRHLSIVTESAYNKDLDGNIPSNKKFEENLRNAVISVRKLRTLVLLGHYDSSFLLLFQEIFQNAHNLRVLQMSATSTDFLKRGYDEVDGAIPQVLSKLYHLQVLNVGSYTDPTIYNRINNLVSLQHLSVHMGVYSSIGSIEAFQEPHGYKFQISSGFEITQLQSTDEFVQHWMHVKTLEEACEAVLRNCELSEKLILFYKETSAHIGMELVCPLPGIKDLQISNYADRWFFSNTVASFQTVHIGGCAAWKILPSLGRFPFLTKLELSCLWEIKEVLVPSLEELVLHQMPKLEICSCTSVEGLNSRLRALEIVECEALMEFDLFENSNKFKIEQRPWLPGLRTLILRDCPRMKVLIPLPPSTISCELDISGVSVLPNMEGLSSEELHIGYLTKKEDSEDEFDEFDVHSDDLTILNDQILAFDNLRNLKSMRIAGCRNLMSFSLEGFSHLVSLKSLEISMCRELFCSDVMSDATLEDLTAANWKAFPCLESLRIKNCGIGGEWLSLLLRHAPDLEELYLEGILPVEKDNLSSGEEDDALTGLAQDGLVHIPLNGISSLKKLTIWRCHLTFNCSQEGFSGFTSLEELIIWEGCAKLLSFLVHKDGNDLTSLKRLMVLWSSGLESLQLLHSCTLEELSINYCKELTTLDGLQSLGSLKKLVVEGLPGLKSLQLHSCTALEELSIIYCEELTTLDGLQSLGRLRHLAVSGCPGLGLCLGFSRQGCELFPQLETLETDDPSVLTMSFCNHLLRLQLRRLVLRKEQGRALVLPKSLQELEFNDSLSLLDLPAGLHLLPSLKKLKIFNCRRISRLPETGLPLSLEELEISYCSKELDDQCKGLATSKLRVTTNECW